MASGPNWFLNNDSGKHNRFTNPKLLRTKLLLSHTIGVHIMYRIGQLTSSSSSSHSPRYDPLLRMRGLKLQFPSGPRVEQELHTHLSSGACEGRNKLQMLFRIRISKNSVVRTIFCLKCQTNTINHHSVDSLPLAVRAATHHNEPNTNLRYILPKNTQYVQITMDTLHKAFPTNPYTTLALFTFSYHNQLQYFTNSFVYFCISLFLIKQNCILAAQKKKVYS